VPFFVIYRIREDCRLKQRAEFAGFIRLPAVVVKTRKARAIPINHQVRAVEKGFPEDCQEPLFFGIVGRLLPTV